MKISTRISVIFSVFSFFVILFFILFINIFSYLNWQKWEEKETLNKTLEHIQEHKNFLEEQLESIEFELFLLVIFVILSYFLSKFLFSKLILKDIYEISDKIKNIDLENIKKFEIINAGDSEINIIKNSINEFLDIIHKNRENLKNFNSQVAHEFKSPLMVILSELEFLKLSWKDKNSYEKIENQIEKLNNLLSNFLLLSKIDNIKNLKREKINLYNLINEILENLEKTYKQKKLNIKNDIHKDIEIYTNKDLFEIIIKNILDNAFKYNKNWGEIEVEFKFPLSLPLEGKILGILTIKDTWIWIKKQNIEKIWNNMFRENEFEKWYWIWLHLVKKVCDILWYKIKVQSQENKWSEFILEIK